MADLCTILLQVMRDNSFASIRSSEKIAQPMEISLSPIKPIPNRSSFLFHGSNTLTLLKKDTKFSHIAWPSVARSRFSITVPNCTWQGLEKSLRKSLYFCGPPTSLWRIIIFSGHDRMKLISMHFAIIKKVLRPGKGSSFSRDGIHILFERSEKFSR